MIQLNLRKNNEEKRKFSIAIATGGVIGYHFLSNFLEKYKMLIKSIMCVCVFALAGVACAERFAAKVSVVTKSVVDKKGKEESKSCIKISSPKAFYVSKTGKRALKILDMDYVITLGDVRMPLSSGYTGLKKSDFNERIVGAIMSYLRSSSHVCISSGYNGQGNRVEGGFKNTADLVAAMGKLFESREMQGIVDMTISDYLAKIPGAYKAFGKKSGNLYVISARKENAETADFADKYVAASVIMLSEKGINDVLFVDDSSDCRNTFYEGFKTIVNHLFYAGIGTNSFSISLCKETYIVNPVCELVTYINISEDVKPSSVSKLFNKALKAARELIKDSVAIADANAEYNSCFDKVCEKVFASSEIDKQVVEHAVREVMAEKLLSE